MYICSTHRNYNRKIKSGNTRRVNKKVSKCISNIVSHGHDKICCQIRMLSCLFFHMHRRTICGGGKTSGVGCEPMASTKVEERVGSLVKGIDPLNWMV